MDRTEYSYSAKTGLITLDGFTLSDYEIDKTYEIKIETDKGFASFNVSFISSNKITFNTESVTFDYNSPEDVVKSADLGEESISRVICGTSTVVDTTYYNYSNDLKCFTLKKEFVATLWGETNVLISLTNGDEFSFIVKSNLIMLNDCEEGDKFGSGRSMFYEKGTNPLVTVEAWDGKALSYSGNGGDIFLGRSQWGLHGGVDFKADRKYVLSFQLKLDETKNPQNHTLAFRLNKNDGTIAPNDHTDNLGYVSLDFDTGTVNLDEVPSGSPLQVDFSKNEEYQFFDVKITFECVGNGMVFECMPGWNSELSDGNTVCHAWLFDNFKIIESVI